MQSSSSKCLVSGTKNLFLFFSRRRFQKLHTGTYGARVTALRPRLKSEATDLTNTAIKHRFQFIWFSNGIQDQQEKHEPPEVLLHSRIVFQTLSHWRMLWLLTRSAGLPTSKKIKRRKVQKDKAKNLHFLQTRSDIILHHASSSSSWFIDVTHSMAAFINKI